MVKVRFWKTNKEIAHNTGTIENEIRATKETECTNTFILKLLYSVLNITRTLLH
jgi:hypothetical protein